MATKAGMCKLRKMQHLKVKASPNNLLLMAPDTPNKKARTTAYEAEQSSKAGAAKIPSNSDNMDEESEEQSLHHTKKND